MDNIKRDLKVVVRETFVRLNFLACMVFLEFFLNNVLDNRVSILVCTCEIKFLISSLTSIVASLIVHSFHGQILLVKLR